jgi:hypothetical protein
MEQTHEAVLYEGTRTLEDFKSHFLAFLNHFLAFALISFAFGWTEGMIWLLAVLQISSAAVRPGRAASYSGSSRNTDDARPNGNILSRGPADESVAGNYA